MKLKKYDEPSVIRDLCEFLEEFEWFRQLDIILCSAGHIGFRFWWHELWVRSEPDHPSAVFDPQIMSWFRHEFLLAWDFGKVTPYEINLVCRWREFYKRFPQYLPRDPEYPIKFDYYKHVLLFTGLH
jgi:hypothetical protein